MRTSDRASDWAAELLRCMIVAGRGRHEQRAIFVICLGLGWTGPGWIVALIRARTDDSGGQHDLNHADPVSSTRGHWRGHPVL